MNANGEMLASNTDVEVSYPDADSDATLFEYRLCWLMYKNHVPVS